jgi:alkylhydroperoxidase family enzyme
MNTRAASAMRQGLTDDLYQQVGRYTECDEFTPREKLAIEFAEQFAIDHRGISDELWQRMAAVFNDQELLELTVTAGFCVGLGRAYQVLDIARDFDVMWSREPSDSPPAAPSA